MSTNPKTGSASGPLNSKTGSASGPLEKPANAESAPKTEETIKGEFTIVNQRGLHARAATKLVQLASRFPCEIQVAGPDGQAANAKSVMGVLLLCGSMGTQIVVRAKGDKAEEAVTAIGRLFADRFGEPE